MRLKFLGTNGWYPSGTGNCVCAAIFAQDRAIVLDAGDGFWKVHNEVVEADIGKLDIFLSHLHLDHTGGLHALPIFEGGMEIRIFLREADKAKLEAILDHPYTANHRKIRADVKVVGLKEGEHSLPYKVKMLPLVHADPCSGFRIEIGGKTISYCTDTGECANMVALSRKADCLISECALLPGEKSDASWPHLSPQMAGGIAKKAGAKRLFLTHFDANRYASLQLREKAQEAARKVFAQPTAAQDGLEEQI